MARTTRFLSELKYFAETQRAIHRQIRSISTNKNSKTKKQKNQEENNQVNYYHHHSSTSTIEMDDYEQNLCTINEVHVFKIPPMQSSEGYKAEGWTQNHLWSGRCRVIAIGDRCEVRLEDPNTGRNFATCHVNGKGSVEPVTDSSRYFVLRIEDARSGRHAFIGIGFSERSDAFDFNVALQDHEKHVTRMNQPTPDFDNEPKTDYSLNDGEKIKVNFKVKTKGKLNTATASTTDRATGGNNSNSSSSAASLSFAPPPSSSSGRSRVRGTGAGGAGTSTTGSSTTSNNNSNTLDFEF